MLEWILIVLVLAVFFLLWLYRKVWIDLQEIKKDRQSILSRHGKSIEQFIPFLKNYPYEKENFRFLGTPIDGIQFEPDKLVFIEFKTGNSRLTAKQKRIKSLVEKKKVKFKEMRID